MFKIFKRFISHNGNSFILNNKSFIRIGNNSDKEYYYGIIDKYKELERTNDAILMIKHVGLIVNPKLDQEIAKRIVNYRIIIQSLQYEANSHYLEVNENIFKKIDKETDRQWQKRHEYIIHLYQDYLNYPKMFFIYPKLI